MKSERPGQPVRKTVVRALFVGCVVLLLAACVAVAAVGFYVHARFETEVPADLFRPSAGGTPPRFFIYRFSDRVNRIGSEEELTTGAFAVPEQSYTPYGELPEPLLDAFVAIEDKRFYRHRGVDWYRTVAAGFTYVLGFSDSFGASTITQQTVKNATGDSEVPLRPNMQDIL